MKFSHLDLNEKYRIEIHFINLIFLFYLFRTAIPLFKYPFLLLYLGFIFYALINYKKRIMSTLTEFVRNYYLLLILAIILAISFLLSKKIYLTIFKDIVNMIILLFMFYISSLIVSGKKELKYFVLNLIYLIVLFAFVISIVELLELLNIYSLNDLSRSNNVSTSTLSEPVFIDYNFALLPVFFGMIGVFYFLKKTKSILQKISFNVLLIMFSFNIVLSGSRRGLFTFITILIFLLTTQIFTFRKRNTLLRKLGLSSRYFLISFFFLFVLTLYMVFNTDYSFKIKVLEFIGSKNISETKTKIAVDIYKYALTIGAHRSFQDFYSILWPIIPEDPDSGWGTRVHKTISHLDGKNVEIVPHGVKGYLMDSTCNASYYDGINLSESFTLLVNLNASECDRYKASVYCFVSDSYDGNRVSLAVGSDCISRNIVSGKVSSIYNLENKGVWQKLEVDFVCQKGEVPILMSFWKKGVKDFSKLKGYVIFAYPKYEKIKKNEDGSSLSITHTKRDYRKSGINVLTKNNDEKKYDSALYQFRKIVDKSNFESTAYDIVFNCNLASSMSSINDAQMCFSSLINPFHLSILSRSGSIMNDQDPIRNLASKFISEDTTYYPYKANIVLDTISNSFINDRASRWEFALKIFSEEYNWKQKLFGGGFNFLNWYGYYFDRDKKRSDYPHNPFLSILLYSGIFGLIVYIIFMFKVFNYYFKYLKEYKILSVFFIITFFFSFFSAGSPFDPPIMGFFVILPFFIHSIYKKDKAEIASK